MGADFKSFGFGGGSTILIATLIIIVVTIAVIIIYKTISKRKADMKEWGWLYKFIEGKKLTDADVLYLKNLCTKRGLKNEDELMMKISNLQGNPILRKKIMDAETSAKDKKPGAEKRKPKARSKF